MSAATTRRQALAGALAGAAAAPALAAAQSAPPGPGPLQARQEIVRRGRAIAATRDGSRVVVAHDRRRTIAVITRGTSRLVDVGGQPLGVAVSPDGRTAAVTTASWDEPGLVLVDLAAAAVRRRVGVGPAPHGVAFTPRGDRLVVTGGDQEGTVHVVATTSGDVLRHAQIGRVPRAVVAAPDGRSAWVALHGDARVVRVSLRSGRVVRRLLTAPFPEHLAISPDGRSLLVSHGGLRDEHVSEIEIATGKVRRRRAGAHPGAIGWTARGRRVVALPQAGEVVVLGRAGRPVRRRAGTEPRALAVAGNRVWTVDAVTGTVRRVKA